MARPIDQKRYDYDNVAGNDEVAEIEGEADDDLDCSWEDVYASYGCSTGIEH